MFAELTFAACLYVFPAAPVCQEGRVAVEGTCSVDGEGELAQRVAIDDWLARNSRAFPPPRVQAWKCHETTAIEG